MKRRCTKLFPCLFLLFSLSTNAQEGYPGWDNYHFASYIIGGGETSDAIWFALGNSITEIRKSDRAIIHHDNASAKLGGLYMQDLYVGNDDVVYALSHSNRIHYRIDDRWHTADFSDQDHQYFFRKILGSNGQDGLLLLSSSGRVYDWDPSSTPSQATDIPYWEFNPSVRGATEGVNGKKLLWDYFRVGYLLDGSFTWLDIPELGFVNSAQEVEGGLWIQDSDRLHFFDGTNVHSLLYEDIGISWGHEPAPLSGKRALLSTGTQTFMVSFESDQLSWRELSEEFPEDGQLGYYSFTDQTDRVWYFSREIGVLWEWEEERGAISLNERPWLSSSDVFRMAVDPLGRVWAGGWGQPIYMSGGNWHTLDFPTELGVNSLVNDILFNQENQPILATDSGFGFFVPFGEVVQWNGMSWDTLDLSGVSFENQIINKIEFDGEYNLWVAGGVSDRFAVFNRGEWFEYELNDLPQFGARFIHELRSDRQGTMWLATDKGVINYDGFRFHTIDSTTLNLGFSGVSDIAFDEEDRLWAAAMDAGVRVWDGQTVEQFLPGQDFPENLSVQRVTIGAQNDVWFTTGWQGILHFDGTNWEHLTVDNSGLHTNGINTIVVDGRGRVWFGGGGGISVFDPGGGFIASFQLPEGERLSVYPNPGCCEFILHWQADVAADYRIELLDAQGRHLRQLWAGPQESGEHQLAFERGQLPAGYYIIRLSGPNGQQGQALIMR